MKDTEDKDGPLSALRNAVTGAGRAVRDNWDAARSNLGSEVAMGFVPGVGEVMDLQDIYRGLRDRNVSQAGMGLLGFVLPGSGQMWKRGGEGVVKSVRDLTTEAWKRSPNPIKNIENLTSSQRQVANSEALTQFRRAAETDDRFLTLEGVMDGRYGPAARESARDQLGGNIREVLARSSDETAQAIEDYGGGIIGFRGTGADRLLRPDIPDRIVPTEYARPPRTQLPVDAVDEIADAGENIDLVFRWNGELSPEDFATTGLDDLVTKYGGPEVHSVLADILPPSTLEELSSWGTFKAVNEAEDIAIATARAVEGGATHRGATWAQLATPEAAIENYMARGSGRSLVPTVYGAKHTAVVDAGGARWNGMDSEALGRALSEVSPQELERALHDVPFGYHPDFKSRVRDGHGGGRGPNLREDAAFDRALAEDLTMQRTDAFAALANELGYDATIISDVMDGTRRYLPSDQIAFHNMSRLRHPQGALDPSQAGRSGLWRSLLPFAALQAGKGTARAEDDFRGNE